MARPHRYCRAVKPWSIEVAKASGCDPVGSSNCRTTFEQSAHIIDLKTRLKCRVNRVSPIMSFNRIVRDHHVGDICIMLVFNASRNGSASRRDYPRLLRSNRSPRVPCQYVDAISTEDSFVRGPLTWWKSLQASAMGSIIKQATIAAQSHLIFVLHAIQLE